MTDDLLLLFVISLLAATILPAQSEAVLASMHITRKYSPEALLLTATSGNVLGSLINWLLGYHLLKLKDCKWFPAKEHSLEKASIIYKKYGIWTLLLAWLPFIGDPLTIMAGFFRSNIWLFITLVTIGKAGRYIAIMAITS